MDLCPNCMGEGKANFMDWHDCEMCGGSGVYEPEELDPDEYDPDERDHHYD